MIEPGRRLGGFEVLSLAGAGGMGEVYRARDRRLDREVALKVLPAAVSDDPVRLRRFEGEARALAALNDPGIAAIFGVEESDGVRFLVLEFVPGETLAERLARGPLPLPEALQVCRQVALALEAAHRKGIVHRDLKCANIKLVPGGAVKVLDFGLATAWAEVDWAGDPGAPTRDLTAEGVIVGTPAYMSPEQARGQAVDARSDVWAWGCVLFETLTGQRAFGGATFSDTIAALLAGVPPWKALPASVPPAIQRVLRRCLERDRNRRFHHLADARLEIEEVLDGPPTARALPWRSWSWSWPWAAVAAAVVVVALAGWRLAGAPSRPVGASRRPRPRLQIALPQAVQWSDLRSGQTPLALSPDGARLVFAAGPSGSRRLYDRPLAELEATAIPGTEGGDNPFFSPDGRWLGFEVEGKLKKVDLRGGEPLVLTDVRSLRGASWGADGTIVFAPSSWSGLSQISAAGGTPRSLTTPDAGRGEISHRWPQILPGGKAALFGIMTASGREEQRSIALVSLVTGERQVLFQGGTSPRYLPTGHLLYARGGTLHAAPFDLGRLRLIGPAVPVLERVLVWAKTSGAAYFDVSSDGSLVYVPAPPGPPARSLVWIDRRGHLQPLPVPPRPYLEPALSPDGRRLAVTIEGPTDDVWIYELDRGVWTRLTFEGDNGAAVWSPDGERLAFTSTRQGARNLYWSLADGSGPAERLTTSGNWQNIVAFAPDGRTLLFTEQDAATLSDIWQLRLDHDRIPRPLIVSPAIELFPNLSPDGRWLAYTSTESRREEVYVRPYPGPGRRWLISRDGGSQPIWSGSGRELVYRNGDKLMAVDVTTDPAFRPGPPHTVATLPFDLGGIVATYSMSADGQRFVAVRGADPETNPPQMVLIPDWFDELRGLMR
jgi:Tol biopolymer transport system component